MLTCLDLTWITDHSEADTGGVLQEGCSVSQISPENTCVRVYEKETTTKEFSDQL